MKFSNFIVVFSAMISSVRALPYVDISKYTGRWFQVYANPFSFYITENAGTCITADYSSIDSSSISILNSELVNGKPKTIRAVGTIINLEEPGKLTVKFENVPINGSYWVYELGPVENGQYQYSIVSDDFKSSLFVLARNVEVFRATYDSKLRDTLRSLGFKESSLIPTNQTDCSY